MGRRTHKNSRISAASYTDLAGNTVYYPGAGELEVPATPFLDHQSINIDGTLTSMPAEDAKLSSETFCDICGVPVDGKKELVKAGGRFRCKVCIDK